MKLGVNGYEKEVYLDYVYTSHQELDFVLKTCGNKVAYSLSVHSLSDEMLAHFDMIYLLQFIGITELSCQYLQAFVAVTSVNRAIS